MQARRQEDPIAPCPFFADRSSRTGGLQRHSGIPQNLDITIASGLKIFNDIARLSLYFGGTGVWGPKYLMIPRVFCMECTDQSLYRGSLCRGFAVVFGDPYQMGVQSTKRPKSSRHTLHLDRYFGVKVSRRSIRSETTSHPQHVSFLVGLVCLRDPQVAHVKRSET